MFPFSFFKKKPVIPDPIIDDDYLINKQMWACLNCESQYLGKWINVRQDNGDVQCPLCRSSEIACVVRHGYELGPALSRGDKTKTDGE